MIASTHGTYRRQTAPRPAVVTKYPKADEPSASTSHVPSTGPSTKPIDVAESDTAGKGYGGV